MKQLGIKYGLIAGLVYIIFALLNYMFDLAAQGGMTGILMWVLSFGLTFFVVYLAAKELKEEQGSITVGEGVKLGVTVALIAALLAWAFGLLYTQVIDPDLINRQMELLREGMEEKGTPDEVIEQTVSVTKMLTKPAISLPFTIIFYVIGGLIKGAISGRILRDE